MHRWGLNRCEAHPQGPFCDPLPGAPPQASSGGLVRRPKASMGKTVAADTYHAEGDAKCRQGDPSCHSRDSRYPNERSKELRRIQMVCGQCFFGCCSEPPSDTHNLGSHRFCVDQSGNPPPAPVPSPPPSDRALPGGHRPLLQGHQPRPRERPRPLRQVPGPSDSTKPNPCIPVLCLFKVHESVRPVPPLGQLRGAPPLPRSLNKAVPGFVWQPAWSPQREPSVGNTVPLLDRFALSTFFFPLAPTPSQSAPFPQPMPPPKPSGAGPWCSSRRAERTRRSRTPSRCLSQTLPPQASNSFTKAFNRSCPPPTVSPTQRADRHPRKPTECFLRMLSQSGDDCRERRQSRFVGTLPNHKPSASVSCQS